MKRAFNTGVTGQDGSYLEDLVRMMLASDLGVMRVDVSFETAPLTATTNTP